MDRIKNELAAMNSQAGRESSRLAALSQDTAKAWKWIQEHQDEFENPVYGPPLIECGIKGGYEQFLDSVESFLSKDLVLSFTTQTRNDYQKLINALKREGLSEFYVKTSKQDITTYQPPMDQDLMRKCGFDGFAVNFIDGPDPVLAMLCGTLRLHAIGIALRGHGNEQHKFLTSERSPISKWVAAGQSFQVVRRQEYGPDAVSINTNPVPGAKFWTEQPVNNSAKQELERRLEEFTQQFNAMKAAVDEIRQSIAKLDKEIKDRTNTREDLKKQKDELQTEYLRYQGIPAQIGL